MRAAVRSFHSPDADLESFMPDDDAGVLLLVQIIAGPAGGAGEESFDLLVCDVRWLDGFVERNGPLLGRHHLIVPRFDWRSIRDFLVRQVEACEGADWHEVAEKVGRIGRWEFEDHRS
jgi:hypothetical protein